MDNRRRSEANRTAWARDQVIGTYGDSSGYAHGFVRSGGQYRTLDFPGARATYAEGVNGRGRSWARMRRRPPMTACAASCTQGPDSTILIACSPVRSYNIHANGINNSDDNVPTTSIMWREAGGAS